MALRSWAPKQKERETVSGQQIVEAVVVGVVIVLLLVALFIMGWHGLFHSEYVRNNTTNYMTLCDHAVGRAVIFVEGKRALVDYGEWCR
jgi:hypothetical protein